MSSAAMSRSPFLHLLAGTCCLLAFPSKPAVWSGMRQRVTVLLWFLEQAGERLHGTAS